MEIPPHTMHIHGKSYFAEQGREKESKGKGIRSRWGSSDGPCEFTVTLTKARSLSSSQLPLWLNKGSPDWDFPTPITRSTEVS